MKIQGANIFWVMAMMGILALFIRVEPKRERASVIDVKAQELSGTV